MTLHRLSDASLSDVRKHPVIVPHDHVAVSLIVRDIHGCAHLGQEWVVCLVCFVSGSQICEA